jgi:hypothetical protein
MSSSCVQNETVEGGAQVPLAQSPLQQSLLPPHVLPAVLHVALSGLHEPETHSVLQQASPPAVHGCPSETHCPLPQLPPVQLRVQQSVLLAQLEPAG